MRAEFWTQNMREREAPASGMPSTRERESAMATRAVGGTGHC